MTYDELIKDLRFCVEEGSCRKCRFDNDMNCSDTLMAKAADAIEKLEGELQALKGDTDMAIVEDGKTTRLCFVKKWIPVTKRLPEKNQEVLIFLFGEDPYIAWHNGEYWCTEDFRLDEPDDWQPTYWFPLPQPPESDGE